MHPLRPALPCCPPRAALRCCASCVLRALARQKHSLSHREANDAQRTKSVPLLLSSALRCSFVACPGGRDNLQAYIAFHAALRSAQQAFVGRMEEATRALLRTHVESATSEFAVNLLAQMPDVPSDDEPEDDVEGADADMGEGASRDEVRWGAARWATAPPQRGLARARARVHAQEQAVALRLCRPVASRAARMHSCVGCTESLCMPMHAFQWKGFATAHAMLGHAWFLSTESCVFACCLRP